MNATNLEVFKGLSAKKFWDAVIAAMDNPFKQYIDYVLWLNSDDSDIDHFICNKGNVLAAPCETEITDFINAYNIENGHDPSDAEVQDFKEKHSKIYLYLDDTTVFGNPYIIAGDMKNRSITKIPYDKVISFDNGLKLT